MRFRVPCGIVKILKYRKIVGENIRTHRRNLGRTQEKLAEKSDLHYNYIGDIERGEENVSVDALGGLFGFKEFALTLSAGAMRIVDAPADNAVVDCFFNFNSLPFAALKSNRGRPEGAEVNPS
jgi:transcriptional regulator with XRE-family HTH domain